VIHLDPVETHMSLELIDDSYNANPTSMSAALAVLAAAEVTNDIGRVSKGRRIAFVGDMKELGPTGADLHGDLADLEALAAIDTVHCIGPLMQTLYARLPAEKQGMWTHTADEMQAQVARRLDSGDVVLVKGSLSMKLSVIVDAIRKMGHPVITGADPQDNA
jgi:UDP-N-acetylmuramoyl-tripeptide--D-alanyl-D-alanine ligase